MTIKPVLTAAQKRSAVADAEKKDVGGGSVGGQVVVVEQSTQHVGQQSSQRAAATHRNVVIDGHGQSPQRRGEVFDELSRHRRSPHKNTRSKRRDHHEPALHHHHHNKREKLEKHGDKSPHAAAVAAAQNVNSAANCAAASLTSGGKSPEHLAAIPAVLGCQSPKSQSQVTQAATKLLKAVEETYSGYNSGDEHLQPKEGTTTADEWQQRDEQFAKCMSERGYVLKPVEEDGACLFRAISLQIYGDEEMHDVIRQHTMDYINKNREYFSHFVTEDINSYIKRKRRKDSHGNHIEIQAMSEIYSRPVEVYCYKPTPINIFNSEQLNNGFAPLRLSYQRGSHYNAIIDPYNATVGVGLGLAGYKPDLQTKEAALLSEQVEIEQTMFEDKLKTTDWEATNEAIEEQIARESYLQWCRENLQKTRTASAANAASSTATSSTSSASSSATVTSAAAVSDCEASPSKYAMQRLAIANNKNSTVTAAFVAAANIGGGSGGSTAATTTCSTAALSSATLEQSFAYSTKSLNALKEKHDVGGGGFDSDDTDMSSTSSLGNSGNSSPSNAASAARAKKTKNRSAGGLMRSSKKRRRDANALTAASVAAASAAALRCVSNNNLENVCKNSPQREVTPSNVLEASEQQPSTSKQMLTPEKQIKDACGNKQQQKSVSSFYQELLAASYEADDAGFGQLSESEMLQRAIQMSTHDYIEDQKRKYLYGP